MTPPSYIAPTMAELPTTNGGSGCVVYVSVARTTAGLPT
jgi:hypothetical protein